MTDRILDNYNPLYDIHLRQYFALPHMQKHLQRMGLLEQTTENGGDAVYARHHAMMDMMLKNREAQLMKMSELKRKLDAAEKVETCRRIRSGQSPESYRRSKPSRSLSRGRPAGDLHSRQRRFSNSCDDKEIIHKIENEHVEPMDYNGNNPYQRLSASSRRFHYLHKMDDPTLVEYKDNLKKQLQRMERFREVSFGVHSVARQQPPPSTSWFFRRRSINALRGRRPNHSPSSKLNASHDSRTSCPPTTRKRRDSNPRLPPITGTKVKSAKAAVTRAPSARLPPTNRKSSASRGRPVTKKTTTTSQNAETVEKNTLPQIAAEAVVLDAAADAILGKPETPSEEHVTLPKVSSPELPNDPTHVESQESTEPVEEATRISSPAQSIKNSTPEPVAELVVASPMNAEPDHTEPETEIQHEDVGTHDTEPDVVVAPEEVAEPEFETEAITLAAHDAASGAETEAEVIVQSAEAVEPEPEHDTVTESEVVSESVSEHAPKPVAEQELVVEHEPEAEPEPVAELEALADMVDEPVVAAITEASLEAMQPEMESGEVEDSTRVEKEVEHVESQQKTTQELGEESDDSEPEYAEEDKESTGSQILSSDGKNDQSANAVEDENPENSLKTPSPISISHEEPSLANSVANSPRPVSLSSSPRIIETMSSPVLNSPSENSPMTENAAPHESSEVDDLTTKAEDAVVDEARDEVNGIINAAVEETTEHDVHVVDGLKDDQYEHNEDELGVVVDEAAKDVDETVHEEVHAAVDEEPKSPDDELPEVVQEVVDESPKLVDLIGQAVDTVVGQVQSIIKPDEDEIPQENAEDQNDKEVEEIMTKIEIQPPSEAALSARSTSENSAKDHEEYEITEIRENPVEDAQHSEEDHHVHEHGDDAEEIDGHQEKLVEAHENEGFQEDIVVEAEQEQDTRETERVHSPQVYEIVYDQESNQEDQEMPTESDHSQHEDASSMRSEAPEHYQDQTSHEPELEVLPQSRSSDHTQEIHGDDVVTKMSDDGHPEEEHGSEQRRDSVNEESQEHVSGRVETREENVLENEPNHNSQQPIDNIPDTMDSTTEPIDNENGKLSEPAFDQGTEEFDGLNEPASEHSDSQKETGSFLDRVMHSAHSILDNAHEKLDNVLETLDSAREALDNASEHNNSEPDKAPEHHIEHLENAPAHAIEHLENAPAHAIDKLDNSPEHNIDHLDNAPTRTDSEHSDAMSTDSMVIHEETDNKDQKSHEEDVMQQSVYEHHHYDSEKESTGGLIDEGGFADDESTRRRSLTEVPSDDEANNNDDLKSEMSRSLHSVHSTHSVQSTQNASGEPHRLREGDDINVSSI